MTILHEDPEVPPLVANPQSFVLDPVYASSVEIDRDPVPISNPTSGPNRFTIHVPSETTVLSLGEASGRWHTDHGITGYTDHHIHFETKDGPRTVVSLGGPATKSSLTGYRGAPPVSTHGYSMVTLENAWHDAQQQHYLLSRTADITLRTKGEGKRAVIQADAGIVDVNGGIEVNIAAGGVGIGAHNGLEMEDVGYAASWGGEVPHSLAAKRSAQFNTISNSLVTAHNLLTGAAHMYKERHKYTKGGLDAATEIFADFAEWLADAVELYRSKGEIEELFAEEESPEKAIKIDAEQDFGISAGGGASFFGTTAASLSAAVWASASAVVSASLKGILFGGIAGTYASVKGYKSTEIGSDQGDVVAGAKKDVKITGTKSFIAVGKELAEVKGEESLYLAGGRKAWIGTTAGGGWGLQFRKDGVMIGKANSANAMKRAWVAPDRSLKISDAGFLLKSGSTEMNFQKTKIESKATQVKIHAKDSDVYVGCKKVLIDA